MAKLNRECLTLDTVSKRFGDSLALDSLSMNVDPGEFVALLGPSGCGKSTTLRLLAGFETPTAGVIRLGERLLSSPREQMPPEKRRMSMVFQSYALWPHLDVAGNVGYPLRVQKMPRERRQRRVEEVLDRVGLSSLANRYPRELSGGQRQRVALARCLISEPAVILLDEPLANLDRHLKSSMEAYFRDFHRDTGTTMLYVTHDQSEAMALADRIAVMQHGRLKQLATPEVLYRQPSDPDVARFVGQGSVLNLARAPVGDWLIGSATHQLDLDGRGRGFVRPQHVRLGVAEGLAARVNECVFRGERYALTLTLSDGQMLAAYSDHPQSPGTLTRVSIDRVWGLDPAA